LKLFTVFALFKLRGMLLKTGTSSLQQLDFPP
jgi:hypothetical protein